MTTIELSLLCVLVWALSAPVIAQSSFWVAFVGAPPVVDANGTVWLYVTASVSMPKVMIWARSDAAPITLAQFTGTALSFPWNTQGLSDGVYLVHADAYDFRDVKLAEASMITITVKRRTSQQQSQTATVGARGFAGATGQSGPPGESGPRGYASVGAKGDPGIEGQRGASGIPARADHRPLMAMLLASLMTWIVTWKLVPRNEIILRWTLLTGIAAIAAYLVLAEWNLVAPYV